MENESTSRIGTVNFEKRRHPRISVDLPLEYWRIDAVKSQSGRIADISEGGLLFYIHEEIEIGRHLRVRLFLDSCLKLKGIEALVEVVWKDFRFEKEGDYRIGVKFVEISSEALEELRDYLITLTNSQNRSDVKHPCRPLSTLGISFRAESGYVVPKSPTED